MSKSIAEPSHSVVVPRRALLSYGLAAGMSLTLSEIVEAAPVAGVEERKQGILKYPDLFSPADALLQQVNRLYDVENFLLAQYLLRLFEASSRVVSVNSNLQALIEKFLSQLSPADRAVLEERLRNVVTTSTAVQHQLVSSGGRQETDITHLVLLVETVSSLHEELAAGQVQATITLKGESLDSLARIMRAILKDLSSASDTLQKAQQDYSTAREKIRPQLEILVFNLTQAAEQITVELLARFGLQAKPAPSTVAALIQQAIDTLTRLGVQPGDEEDASPAVLVYVSLVGIKAWYLDWNRALSQSPRLLTGQPIRRRTLANCISAIGAAGGGAPASYWSDTPIGKCLNMHCPPATPVRVLTLVARVSPFWWFSTEKGRRKRILAVLPQIGCYHNQDALADCLLNT